MISDAKKYSINHQTEYRKMSDEPNTNIFADEIFADKITATESIEVEQINSNKVVISGELDAATITGDGSKLTGVQMDSHLNQIH